VATLIEIVNGQLVASSSEISPADSEPVRAVDVVDSWGAAFRFTMWENGDWAAETTLASRSRDGIWQDRGSGGSHGSSPGTDWVRPPVTGWAGQHLAIAGLCSCSADDNDDDPGRELVAVFGFASPSVVSVRARCDGTERTIQPSPAGAFVAVALGSGFEFLELAALDGDGLLLGDPGSFPTPPEGRLPEPPK
jgi:hypothetical protein